jgi:tetratricopeptide (TPR) repeat protein
MYLPIAALAIAIGAAIANARLRNHRVAMIAVGISAVAFVLTTQRAGVWSSSLTFWQDVVTKSPGNVRAYRNLTQSYVASGRCEDAIKHLERGTASVPRDYFVLVNWAQAYRCAQRPEAALKKLDEADRLRPSAFVSGIRGELLLKMGRTDEAREAFAQAVALEKPGTDLAYVYEGNLAFLRNNYVEAAEAYRRAIAVNPASPEATSLLRRLEPIIGRNERAGNPWQPQSP